MILVILALAWIAFLAPVVVRKIRDMGSDRSIDHFHAEHEVLSRQGYAVEPAYRLDDYADAPTPQPVRRATLAESRVARPRLTVVKDDDTYRSLESRQSWQEWSEDYDYDRGDAVRPVRENRYASAYSAVPRELPLETHDEPVRAVRSMRRRRRVMITRLALATVVASGAAFVSSVSLVFDLAVLTWLADVSYVALALFALSQGYLSESSVGLGRTRGLAPVEPLYRDDEEDGRGHVAGGYGRYEQNEQYEDYDNAAGSGWAHASSARYALG
ncbi:MAG: hypothetical protein KGJ39_09030 [Acidobacteriota bacterium]|nr:hypothetical protein [Acidobacteriota bacterium]